MQPCASDFSWQLDSKTNNAAKKIREPATPGLLAVDEFFLLANALPVECQAGPQLETGLRGPRLGVRLRIFDRNLVAQRVVVDVAPQTLHFHDMQGRSPVRVS